MTVDRRLINWNIELKILNVIWLTRLLFMLEICDMFENFKSGKKFPFCWNLIKLLCKCTTCVEESTVLELKSGGGKLLCWEGKLICNVLEISLAEVSIYKTNCSHIKQDIYCQSNKAFEEFLVKPNYFNLKVKFAGDILRGLT